MHRSKQCSMILMKNPLDRDVIVANAVAVGTGFKAYREGMTGMDAFNVGMWWRWWYKNMTMSVVLFGIVLAICTQTGQWGYLVAQGVLNTLVAGITYCSLINVSGFKQRLAFRIWWPAGQALPLHSAVLVLPEPVPAAVVDHVVPLPQLRRQQAGVVMAAKFVTTYEAPHGERLIIARQGKTLTLTVSADGPTITVEMPLDDWLILTQRFES